MFKNIFFIVFYLFLFLNSIFGGKTTNYKIEDIKHGKIPSNGQLISVDKLSDRFRNMFSTIISDENHLYASDSLEKELEEAAREDTDSVAPLSGSLINTHHDPKASLLPAASLLANINQEFQSVPLLRVTQGKFPDSIMIEDYSNSEKENLLKLYQSHQSEDSRKLFQFITHHIHKKSGNCALNRRSEKSIPYQNCIPCANAIDLNLEDLFNNELDLPNLKKYIVNTCDTKEQWISYIGEMYYLPESSTFTNTIRQNLLPNHRYIFEGLIKPETAPNEKSFRHVCNLITDDHGQIWIIDGEIERVYSLHHGNDIRELNRKFRSDYIARASTGMFRPKF